MKRVITVVICAGIGLLALYTTFIFGLGSLTSNHNDSVDHS